MLIPALTLLSGLAVGLGIGLLLLRALLMRRTEELERRIAERTAELAATEKRALEANRAKSAFLANMSHELRTPLNGILGFAQLLERKRGLDPEDRESIAIITRSGEHLLSLINSVLSLAKIEAGHVELSAEAFDLGVLLKDVSDLLRARAATKELTLTLETGELPKAVTGDPGKLRQILLNLVGNAVKFTARGRVTLRARWKAGRALFEVEDTGTGISSKWRNTLFQPFTQADSGRRSQEGTGLGLALSRELARLMGGDITVTTVRGRGSTFRVELDLPEASASAVRVIERRRVTALAPGTEAPRVLVVDDSAENRLLLSRLLRSVGFDVREATSGEEAVSGWKSFSPQVIFMDKRMPKVSGLVATRRIREAERRAGSARTVIVAVSASAMEHERGEILAAGCDDFIAKPFRESTIFETLSQRLGITYVFEADGQSGAAPPALQALTPERLARLPGPLRDALYQAFQAGNFDAARETAEQARPLDGALADALVRAADDYRSDEALAALAPTPLASGSEDPSGAGRSSGRS